MILVLVDVPEDFDDRVERIDDSLTIRRDADALLDAEVIFGRPDIAELSRAKNLKWLQLSSAGANRYVNDVGEDVVLTTASGVYGVPAAEHVLAMMLSLARAIPHSVRAAQSSEWDRSRPCDELFGRTCGVLGLGDIGLEVARRAQAFGMRVIGMKRTRGICPDFVDEVFVVDELDEVLAQSDHIVNTLPDTKDTHHMIDGLALKNVRPGSYFYNVGRGRTVDEAALVGALQQGTLAGAGLDVFESEPLPKKSPLWRMPNVIVTPHVAGSSPREDERVAHIFLENLKRWVDGQPLNNVVDRELEY